MLHDNKRFLLYCINDQKDRTMLLRPVCAFCIAFQINVKSHRFPLIPFSKMKSLYIHNFFTSSFYPLKNCIFLNYIGEKIVITRQLAIL